MAENKEKIRKRVVRTVKFINGSGRILRSLGLPAGQLSVKRILAKAKKNAGVVHIPDDSFLEPLDVLVRSVNEQPGLNMLGRLVLRENLVQKVSNRLQIDAFVKDHPDLLGQPIERPVFIVALPRTGTTILHRMFACDPSLRVPHYREWMEHKDFRFVYERHKKQLQLLQYRYTSDRWVLKAPFHLRALGSLMQVYPDAVIIQTHRDPSDVIASTASLYASFRSMLHDRIDVEQIGPVVLDRLATYLDNSMAERDREEANPDSRVRFIDVHYKDIVADPIGSLQAVYETCGLSWPDAHEKNLTEFLEQNKQAKYGKHTYTLEQFGLDHGQVQERFAAYNQHFINNSVLPYTYTYCVGPGQRDSPP